MPSIQEALERELASVDELTLQRACDFVSKGYRAHDIEGAYFKDAGDTGAIKDAILYCRAELFEIICNPQNKKYDKERIIAKQTGAGIANLLSGLLVLKFGISAAAATAVAIGVMSLPIRVTANAWCKYFRDTQLSRFEQEALLSKGTKRSDF